MIEFAGKNPLKVSFSNTGENDTPKNDNALIIDGEAKPVKFGRSQSTFKRRNAAASLGRIGIITNDFDSIYYGHIVQGASSYLLKRGFQALVQSSFSSHLGQVGDYFSLTNCECDGLIVHADALSDAELNTLISEQPNAVILNRFLPSSPSRCVYCANEEGGRLAARCLLDHGHERIAMVQGRDTSPEARERTLGFTRELEQRELEVTSIVSGNFDHDSGEQAMERIVKSNDHITAVFFHNDEMAFGALKACKRLNINVPDDISIIGFDGLPMCNYVFPRLTSVQQPLHQIGEHAAQLVCDLLLGNPDAANSKNNCYTPVLNERESVAPPSGVSSKKTSLTKRETECLSWTAGGKTSWEISIILGISESTATFHLRNAGVKLNANNRTHAVAKAMHEGLIELAD
ncbi:MAG: substrate-binding domain-containing protein [Granulosicoccus sp.]